MYCPMPVKPKESLVENQFHTEAYVMDKLGLKPGQKVRKLINLTTS